MIMDFLGAIVMGVLVMFIWSVLREGFTKLRKDWYTPEERAERAKKGY